MPNDTIHIVEGTTRLSYATGLGMVNLRVVKVYRDRFVVKGPAGEERTVYVEYDEERPDPVIEELKDFIDTLEDDAMIVEVINYLADIRDKPKSYGPVTQALYNFMRNKYEVIGDGRKVFKDEKSVRAFNHGYNRRNIGPKSVSVLVDLFRRE